jgi:hypothetical protein
MTSLVIIIINQVVLLINPVIFRTNTVSFKKNSVIDGTNIVFFRTNEVIFSVMLAAYPLAWDLLWAWQGRGQGGPGGGHRAVTSSKALKLDGRQIKLVFFYNPVFHGIRVR